MHNLTDEQQHAEKGGDEVEHLVVAVLGYVDQHLSSKYRSQVKSIPSEVHNAAIITCARTSLSISESCEFPLKTSFIYFTCIQALIPLSVSALDPGYLELTKHKFLNDF